MRIDWTKWSAIAEVLSSVAIIATLIYLSIQTQQNADAIQANTRHAMIQTDVEVLMGALAEPGAVSAMTSESPTDDELRALEAYLVALVRTREHQWFQYRSGQLDRPSFEAYISGLTSNLSFPRTRAWWNYVKYSYFDDEFVDAVDDSISSTPINQDGRPTIAIAEELAN